MKKKEAVLITVIFSALLLIPLIATVITPTRDFSEWENRNLAQAPEISAERIFSGQFGEDAKNFFTDQFVARDFWNKLKRGVDSVLLIRESDGVYIGKNALFDIPDKVDDEKFEKNISAINEFCKRFDVSSSVILVPSSGALFPEELPFAAPSFKDKELIDEAYSKLETVTTVDTAKVLSSMTLTEAFYKTDHHWTSRGAASVYAQWRAKDVNYDFVEVSDNFFGTLTSRSGDIGVDADKIEKVTSGDRFTSCKIFNGVSVAEYSSMYFEEYLEKKDKYSYFLGTNEPVVTLESDCENGKTLIVFKDSYAHSFIQCASEDWSRIILVDLRYLKEKVSECEYIPLDEADEILFLYGIENFTTQNYSWILY